VAPIHRLDLQFSYALQLRPGGIDNLLRPAQRSGGRSHFFNHFFSLLWAVSLAGAIGMILELEKGFGGLIHVSPQPMRQAVDESEAQLHE